MRTKMFHVGGQTDGQTQTFNIANSFFSPIPVASQSNV